MESCVKLENIKEAIAEISKFERNLQNLRKIKSVSDDDKVLQELNKLITNYNQKEPHQQIANLAEQWKNQQLTIKSMSDLLCDVPKAWGTEYSRLPKTHVTERFFDRLATEALRGCTFLLYCYVDKKKISNG